MTTETALKDLWSRASAALIKRLSKPIYETIISSTRPIAIEDGILLLAVPNVFSQDWLIEKKCDSSILLSINESGGGNVRAIKFVVIPRDDLSDMDDEKEKNPASLKSAVITAPFLNPRYTFDNFVVGHGNRFAHAATLAVSESPGKAYNPLFLYGGVGLGKTHLMQAVGFHILKTNPKAKVAYLTSEKFTNEVIDSIRYDRMNAFRNKYRGVDVLMIDDIQFIKGKERTQEEFFHTFNALYEANKQIIISNDRPPKEIEDVEERLRNRFEWGLIADIQQPDFETRVAILKKKAELEEISVPDDVLTLIATKITANIRELEGALIRLIAHSAIESRDITSSNAEEFLKDIFSPAKSKPPVTIEMIKKATADYYSLKIDDMSAKTRTREIATARQIAMFLSRELTSASLPKIGSSFGGRDHTTVMHAIEKIRACIKDDKDIAGAVNTITQLVKSLCQ
ncbi:MAG: chromosomal replication initiator protein DnaA [Candidatus Saganbacteria bacterium]|nr:chromosomal replication initiator protein DnaA [Candidatus Saganbacteria bacterium]